MVVAYEPVWAIGTGRIATPEQAGEVHAHIRRCGCARGWGEAAELCHVIYGGTSSRTTSPSCWPPPDVDGALVGGASLDVGLRRPRAARVAARLGLRAERHSDAVYTRSFRPGPEPQSNLMLYYLFLTLYVLVCLSR